ncbi:Asp/Glu racemase [Vandammella animalimorsus]|uniref:Asp/Glu racemase n=1 Tax=Vandammella animalimorsus TaxID=2029117 RepID=A0A3M6RUV5_9BURK|nr:aspartate/glutamate racemase family protein [Vandammella animalimorsus]RMX18808.1 Asp/Glu racemase [Vandammella animalimorsus]
MKNKLETSYEILPFSMGAGLMSRAAIGLVVLATDQTMEYEWRRIMNLPGVAYFHSRIPSPQSIQPETLMAMRQDIASAVATILPGVKLQVVAFGCTSGAIVIGEGQIFNEMRKSQPQACFTTPITAAKYGLKRLGARRVALITPYVESINKIFQGHLQSAGFQVRHIATFNHPNDAEVAKIDATSLENAVLQVGGRDDVDAVFVSCTSLCMCDQTKKIEQQLCKPVISSNSAMAWHALRLAEIEDILPQWGMLFEC